MSVTIQMRRDTAANWASVNPVLAQGEIGVETDTLREKVGDGSTAWNSLAYRGSAGGVLTGFIAPKVVTLSQSGGLVAVDWSQGNVFGLLITASGWTISNPSSPSNGQVVRMRLKQDPTGSRTLSWGSAYDWGTGNSAPGLTTGLGNVTDYVAFEWDADISKAVYLGAAFPQGF